MAKTLGNFLLFIFLSEGKYFCNDKKLPNFP